MNILFERFIHNPALLFIFGIIIFILIVFISWKAGRISAELKFRRVLKTERADAVNRSKAVLAGLAAEQIAPFLPNFPCNPADCRFVGKPVDFVAFSTENDGEVKEILFIEVKNGTSQLSKREREIKKCVEENKVRYIEYRTSLESKSF